MSGGIFNVGCDHICARVGFFLVKFAKGHTNTAFNAKLFSCLVVRDWTREGMVDSIFNAIRMFVPLDILTEFTLPFFYTMTQHRSSCARANIHGTFHWEYHCPSSSNLIIIAFTFGRTLHIFFFQITCPSG